MATGDTPLLLSRKTQEAIIQYNRLAQGFGTDNWDVRSYLRESDLAYMREWDLTAEQQRALLANKLGDPTKIQNVIIPLIYSQVETAVDYLTSVFLTGYPMFAFSAGPDTEAVAKQYNAIMAENQTRGQWARHLRMFFRDGLKYNLNAIEVAWDTKKVYSVETDISYKGGVEGKTNEILWAGNCIKRLDLYNTYFDKRVAPADIHAEGEFAGYVEFMSRIQLKKMINDMPQSFVSNLPEVFESGLGAAGYTTYYLPQLNPQAMMTKSPQEFFDWMSWVNNQPIDRKINYKNGYEVSRLFARIIPADFGMAVPAKNTPQIWKFIIVNNQVLLWAERMTNAHDYLPIIFGQPLEDGLRYQTKSFAANIKPFQDMSSALWNSRIASARRRISDRMFYNPIMVRKEDINSPEPSAKIPVRNSAYGRKLEEAVYPVPFNDQGSNADVQDAAMIQEMSYFASGQNKVSQGQFQKGNKSVREFDTTMANANSRDQGVAIFLEAQVFTPAKEIMKMNILQYQPNGEIYTQTEGPIQIDSLQLRQNALQFQVSDGLSPVDKLMSTDEWAVTLQTLTAAPALAAGYNLPPMFSYMMSLRGLTGLEKFEKSPLQQQYESQLQNWQEVAIAAIKAGSNVPPQPPMPPALIQELQQKQAAQQAASGTQAQVQPQTPAQQGQAPAPPTSPVDSLFSTGAQQNAA